VFAWSWYGGSRIHAERDALTALYLIYDYLKKYCANRNFQPMQDVTWSVGVDHVFSVAAMRELDKEGLVEIRGGQVALPSEPLDLAPLENLQLFARIAAAVQDAVGLPYHLQWRILYRARWNHYAGKERQRANEWRELPQAVADLSATTKRNRLWARLALGVGIISLVLGVLRLVLGVLGW